MKKANYLGLSSKKYKDDEINDYTALKIRDIKLKIKGYTKPEDWTCREYHKTDVLNEITQRAKHNIQVVDSENLNQGYFYEFYEAQKIPCVIQG